MNQTQLEHIRTRLQKIIKESRDILKLIDDDLRPATAPKKESEKQQELLVIANSHYTYQDVAAFVDDLFKRTDINIYMVGLTTSAATNLFNFNLVKDGTVTPISVAVPTQPPFNNRFDQIMRSRFLPKTGQHLKSLLNKHIQRTIQMNSFFPYQSNSFTVNVVETAGPSLLPFRHRNVTYLFDINKLSELNTDYRILMGETNQTRASR